MTKKLSVLVVSLMMLLGVGFTSSAWSAVEDINFSIDFGQDGIMDTAWTLAAGDSVMVDLWVNEVPAPGLVGFGFGFGVLPGAEINFEILDVTITTGIATPSNELFLGGFYAESWAFPGSTLEGAFKMVSFELLCTKPSIDELFIYDYLPGSAQWVMGDGTIIDDIILPQHLATLTQTPVPAAIWLLASGLLGIVGIKRKKS